MKKLIRELMVLGMLGIFMVGVAVPGFAQGRGRDKRPPKDPATVRSDEKRRDPPRQPPQNSNRPKGDKKKP